MEKQWDKYLNKIVWLPKWNFAAKVIFNYERAEEPALLDNNDKGISWEHLEANGVNPEDLKILGEYPKDSELLNLKTEINIEHDQIDQSKSELIGYQVFFDDNSNIFCPIKDDKAGVNVSDLPAEKTILRIVQVGKLREKTGSCKLAKSMRKINDDLIYYPNKCVHLRYNMYDSPNGHPQIIMKELGITYQDCTPQSMGDQWWFWNCENIPNPLPKYLEVANLNPMECIGYGLSQEDAEKIRDYKK